MAFKNRVARRSKIQHNIVTLISLKFSISSCQNLSHAEILEFTSTASDVLHLISEYEKVSNIKTEITLI